MPVINEIESAVYRLLKEDTVLGGLCAVYKGAKRPVRASNPCLTAEIKRLAPGSGEGIRMCDIVLTAYADVTANLMSSGDTLGVIAEAVHNALDGKTPEIAGAKVMPLIEGGTDSGWDPEHERETWLEMTYGLVFVKF